MNAPGHFDRAQPRLAESYARTRALSLHLAEPLSDADATVQSMPDASPTKWHLAHTTWFFETFVLRDHLPGYRLFNEDYPYLFNSYYEAEGPRHARHARGLITRPSLDAIRDWRRAVDDALLSSWDRLPEAARVLVELGLAHEQQHQELLVTDLLHLLAQNPLGPVAYPDVTPLTLGEVSPIAWQRGQTGEVRIGHDGVGFGFDCEGPRHRVWLHPHAIASRPVTNGEWQEFMADGGYRDARLWLSDGWAWVQREGIAAPAYWREGGEERFSLAGWQRLDPHAPVAHVSFYEADAFASWAGARLPTEAEWEAWAAPADPQAGDQLDGRTALIPTASGMAERFGGVWEWTGSAYRPYPGFRAAEGAVGEYNGKFMSGQAVLRGGSCATPRGHLRPSYRNFFYPHQRWQVTGVRLARDAG